MSRKKTGRDQGRPTILERHDDTDYWYIYGMLMRALHTPGKIKPFTLAKQALENKEKICEDFPWFARVVDVSAAFRLINNVNNQKMLVRKFNTYINGARTALDDANSIFTPGLLMPASYGEILLTALDLIAEKLAWSCLTREERQIADAYHGRGIGAKMELIENLIRLSIK
jgi:hypothetical protein